MAHKVKVKVESFFSNKNKKNAATLYKLLYKTYTGIYSSSEKKILAPLVDLAAKAAGKPTLFEDDEEEEDW